MTTARRDVAVEPASITRTRLDVAITIFHNSGCGTSRNTLALIRAAGHEPTIVDYLKTGL